MAIESCDYGVNYLQFFFCIFLINFILNKLLYMQFHTVCQDSAIFSHFRSRSVCMCTPVRTTILLRRAFMRVFLSHIYSVRTYIFFVWSFFHSRFSAHHNNNDNFPSACKVLSHTVFPLFRLHSSSQIQSSFWRDRIVLPLWLWYISSCAHLWCDLYVCARFCIMRIGQNSCYFTINKKTLLVIRL